MLIEHGCITALRSSGAPYEAVTYQSSKEMDRQVETLADIGFFYLRNSACGADLQKRFDAGI